MKTKPQFRSAATLTIHRAADMTRRGRREVAAWLRRQLELFETEHKNLGPRYTARYLYSASGSVRRARA